MHGTHWIVEGRIDPRWPINTRGNIGEVFPEVLTPLSYELGVKPAEAGWREAYTMLGVHDRRDFATDEPTIIGLFGGYGYLNLSYLRILGVRAPGSSAQAIDVSLFGEGDPPAAAAAYAHTVRELTPPNAAAGTGDTPRFDLILLGMGAGVAPLLSLVAAHHTTRRTHLLWSVRTPEDLYYSDTLDAYQAASGGKMQVTTSVGRFRRDDLEGLLSAEAVQTGAFFVVGSSPAVLANQRLLRRIGVSRRRIHQERLM